jgi:DNA polymerase-4
MITRSKSFDEPMDELSLIIETAKELLLNTEPDYVKIRLLGISVSNFGERVIARKNIPGQLPLFD